MKTFLLLALAVAFQSCSIFAAQESRFFELRTYYAAPGKLDALQARFRDHTVKLFEKHGITNIGYWTPLTNTDNKLIYMLAFPDRAAHDKSWKEFGADPDWKAAAKASEVNGKLVTRVTSVFLTATDFSPAVTPSAAAPPRTFELRIYQASPGKLDALLARFRDHTTTLFTRHGMQQIGYWVPTEAKDGAGEKLIYLLAHKDVAACDASFAAFRADPEWIKVKQESEANGALTVKDGVQSILMTPTDFSPAK